jgi:hypothetical protein
VAATRTARSEPSGSTRNSLEPPLLRAASGLPRVNRLTDAYNAVSMRHQVTHSLRYVSLEGLVAASEQPRTRLCPACFDGTYPIPLPEIMGKHVLEGIERAVSRDTAATAASPRPGRRSGTRTEIQILICMCRPSRRHVSRSMSISGPPPAPL